MILTWRKARKAVEKNEVPRAMVLVRIRLKDCPPAAD
jgi:hypothetical protein